MTRYCALAVMFTFCVFATPARSQEPPNNNADKPQVAAIGAAPFMQQKLVHTKSVLEGVVLKDFDRIIMHGQKLSLLSLDSSWQVIQSPEYAEQSAEFRRAANAMVKAAKNKNIDAAAYAYVDLTMKCINCHKSVLNWQGSPESAVSPPQ